ncbi:MAG TPA: cation diffusion facilitator family transporter [Candidatus Sulfomarinibacteraceae bacterium]|nr:cation diffusion facilitator family transporter [Candidatus Sulfomarinibacteraceae bacterium]
MEDRQKLTRFAWLSIATAVVTIALKTTAYLITGSVGLFSDALESGVNLLGAIATLVALTVAARPPDEEHAYGHAKAEYFSGGLEGGLIVIAAAMILASAVERLIHPQPLQQLNLGLAVSLVAAALNLVVALVLLRAGREYESTSLKADARHLLTDVMTSAGVLLGIGAVLITGWQTLDPIIAILVALQILRSGTGLVRDSVRGLMDTALPDEEQERIMSILEAHTGDGVTYHALRTRRSGAQRFVSVHIQVPGRWSVQKGHRLLEKIEGEVRQALPRVAVFTHLEPAEDPVSWQDISLHRGDGPHAPANDVDRER